MPDTWSSHEAAANPTAIASCDCTWRQTHGLNVRQVFVRAIGTVTVKRRKTLLNETACAICMCVTFAVKL